MPCAGIHMHLAGRVLEALDASPGDVPFSLRSPGDREWFLHGAVAPDWGYVPGVDRFFSELSHYVRTADLARALLEMAATERESAFAWGWATHVLGDIEIHPVVGRACGERLFGDRNLRLNSAVDVSTHVALEVGLDIVFLDRHRRTPPPPPRPVFDRDTISLVVRALRATYAIDWDPEALLQAHRRATRLTAGWPRALSVLGRGRGVIGNGRRSVTTRVLGAAVGAAALASRAGTPMSGFFAPVRPPDWMLDEVETIGDGFADRFREAISERLASLPNHNLESGVADGLGIHHPAAAETRSRLDAVRTRAAS